MDWILFAIFLLATFGAGATGAMFPPGDWYDRLEKPPWTPPNWVFPVVWTSLYLALAFVGARLAPMAGSEYAMAFWAMQIAFNALWTPVFFGLRKMRAAFVVMLLLWVAVAGLVASAWPLDRLSALLMLPYLLWVTIAGALNASVLRRNPSFA
ncbi:tryptophan-rich sensory protein TspO [Jannaschia seohaensis]|uniref:Tryptophan-rich sensory protein n=1 Tax=Jannaschia seohaensis TaxID=475081 RepID=A0A2Y9A282_9RHOB|nr:TspO/MBR family protein [Jannaschia seohaensis]PWJ21688.1 tryptophan-rich sensory protein [Jannaschia seohaensis]SSA37966.1 tryptophan-rich sensory protein [Jannaschia seohaensis]